MNDKERLRNRYKLLEKALKKIKKIKFVENVDMDVEVEKFINSIKDKMNKIHLELLLRRVLTEEETEELIDGYNNRKSFNNCN